MNNSNHFDRIHYKEIWSFFPNESQEKTEKLSIPENNSKVKTLPKQKKNINDNKTDSKL